MVETKKFSKRLWEFYCALVCWIFYYKPVGITKKDREKIWKQEKAKEIRPSVYQGEILVYNSGTYDRTQRRLRQIVKWRKEFRKEERKKRKNEMRQAFKALF